MTNYTMFLVRLAKCTTRIEVDDLMTAMCVLYKQGGITTKELMRMDARAVDYTIELEEAEK